MSIVRNFFSYLFLVKDDFGGRARWGATFAADPTTGEKYESVISFLLLNHSMLTLKSTETKTTMVTAPIAREWL